MCTRAVAVVLCAVLACVDGTFVVWKPEPARNITFAEAAEYCAQRHSGWLATFSYGQLEHIQTNLQAGLVRGIWVGVGGATSLVDPGPNEWCPPFAGRKHRRNVLTHGCMFWVDETGWDARMWAPGYPVGWVNQKNPENCQPGWGSPLLDPPLNAPRHRRRECSAGGAGELNLR